MKVACNLSESNAGAEMAGLPPCYVCCHMGQAKSGHLAPKNRYAISATGIVHKGVCIQKTSLLQCISQELCGGDFTFLCMAQRAFATSDNDSPQQMQRTMTESTLAVHSTFFICYSNFRSDLRSPEP